VKSVCVFCGARSGADDHWVGLATQVGRALGQQGIRTIYGGGSVGLMGAVAGGALEAGGEVVGVIPHFLMGQELGTHDITRLEQVDDMAQRKVRMMELSDGFLTLPGGLGTLDELFEVMTLAQVGQHDKPCAVLNAQGYFDSLFALFESFVGAGFVGQEHVDRLLIDTEVQPLLNTLVTKL